MADEVNTDNDLPGWAIRRGAFAVLMETPTQGPILMEAEAPGFSRDAAEKRMHDLIRSNRAIRGCVVKLEFITGNSALLASIETKDA